MADEKNILREQLLEAEATIEELRAQLVEQERQRSSDGKDADDEVAAVRDEILAAWRHDSDEKQALIETLDGRLADTAARLRRCGDEVLVLLPDVEQLRRMAILEEESRTNVHQHFRHLRDLFLGRQAINNKTEYVGHGLYHLWKHTRAHCPLGPSATRILLNSETQVRGLSFNVVGGEKRWYEDAFDLSAEEITGFVTEVVIHLPCLHRLAFISLPSYAESCRPWIHLAPPTLRWLHVRETPFTTDDLESTAAACPALEQLQVTPACWRDAPQEASNRSDVEGHCRGIINWW